MKKVLALAVLAIALAIGGFVWTSRTTAASPFLVLHGNVDIRQVSLAFDGSGASPNCTPKKATSSQPGRCWRGSIRERSRLQAEQAAAQIEVQEQTLRRVRSGARPQEVEQARSRLDGGAGGPVRGRSRISHGFRASAARRRAAASADRTWIARRARSRPRRPAPAEARARRFDSSRPARGSKTSGPPRRRSKRRARNWRCSATRLNSAT